ncbi:hemin uptake protein HemP [Reyranella sp.]|uniref:hemin uptake protein HemP n=1 Tax=Reyranella sp. TaxID=1929291 RepID=UPI003BACAF64
MEAAQPIAMNRPAPEADDPSIRSVESAELLNGNRELLIRHGDNTYRLRLTQSDKLILTK